MLLHITDITLKCIVKCCSILYLNLKEVQLMNKILQELTGKTKLHIKSAQL